MRWYGYIKVIFGVSLLVAGCSNNTPSPNLGQWTCFHCTGMTLNGDGSFTFPNSNGAVGYIYTGVMGNPTNRIITLNYTVSGTGTVLPSAASGAGTAQVRLFLWRKDDDLSCSPTTEWYRWWAKSAGPLTEGQHVVSAVIDEAEWTDCLGKQNAGQFAAAMPNLLGVGFTFGSEFFGHGVYSTGSNTFTLNSFSVQ